MEFKAEAAAHVSDGEIEKGIGKENDSLTLRTGHNGVTLIPYPSNDPLDPLNWSTGRKLKILAVISLATFAGFSACLAGQLQVVPQSLLYNVSTTRMAYQNSAGSVGMATGGFIFLPLSHILGRSSAIFWSLFGTLLTQIWAALMIHRNDYDSFIVSRAFSGFFGSVTAVLGPRILVDLFFLHQRGRAFTVFHWCFSFGTVAGPTLSAFISARRSWTDAYWWTAGLVAFTLFPVFFFLHDTSWDRGAKKGGGVRVSAGFLANRVATFFMGNKVTSKTSFAQVLRVAATPFLIMASPVTLILAVFTLVHFGFYVALNSLSPVWLQKPIAGGGYGFSVEQNAAFSLTHWAGVAIALIYGHFISDRLPLFICARNGGIWRPEYRLHALWIPGLIFNPLGLAIFGAGLQYDLSWGALAVATVFVTFGSLSIPPITVNYLCECFIDNPVEASVALNFYRVSFGLSVAFYIKQWVAAVTIGWAYGMMAIFEVFSLGSIAVLLWKGRAIREWSVGSFASSEDGLRLVEDKKHVGLATGSVMD